MPSPLVLIPAAVGQGQASVAYVEVVKPLPRRTSDPLYYVFPDWTRAVSFPVLHWPAIHGSELPAENAAALLQKDSRGIWRCTWWESAAYVDPRTLSYPRPSFALRAF